MLTVEELVIESLYHRLILVNVKKQGDTSHTQGQGRSHDEEVGSDVEEVEGVRPPSRNQARTEEGGSGDGAGQPGDGGGGHQPGGLGFLVINAMNPYLKRAYGLTPTFKLNVPSQRPALTDAGQREDSGDAQTPLELIQQQGLDVTEDIQMILDTGEIQLMKTTLTSPGVQVDLPPTWTFGPSPTTLEAGDDGDKEESLTTPQQGLLPRGVSLDSCNQFSLVKIQDKRDPAGRSLVMLQTADSDTKRRPDMIEAPSKRQALMGAKLTKAKSLPDAESSELQRGGKRNRYVSPVPAPAVTTDTMSVYVQQNPDLDEDEGEDGSSEPMVPHSQSDKVTSTQDQEIDSGIWDMIRGVDSKLSTRESTRESTPVVTTSSGNHRQTEKHADQQVSPESVHFEESIDEGKEVEPYRMTGTYWLFNVSQNLHCEVKALKHSGNGDQGMALEYSSQANDNYINPCKNDELAAQVAQDDGAKVESSRECNGSPESKAGHVPEKSRNQSSVGEASSMLGNHLTKPVAEVTFSIEASETETESTMSSITDIHCEVAGSLPASPLKAVSLGSSPAKSLVEEIVEEVEEEEAEDAMPGESDTESVYRTPMSFSDFELSTKQSGLRQSEAESVIDQGRNTYSTQSRDQVQESTSNAPIRKIHNHRQVHEDKSPASTQSNAIPDGSYQHSGKRVNGNPCRPKDLATNSNLHPVFQESSSRYTSQGSRIYRPRSPRGVGGPSPAPRRRPGSLQTTFPPDSPPNMTTPGHRRVSQDQVYIDYSTGSSQESIAISTPIPRRGHPEYMNDSGISAALKPPSRVITYRDPMSPSDGRSDLTSEMSDSYLFCESSDGDESIYELDLPYDVPNYPKHPNWMSELPQKLHTVPINHLVIPGSHISLAIDRDMRMDMDFSKCNYEMAEFLRKLPNLAVFNNFRGLMKKIWKAWMPKQTLTIPQQLECGVRYLDLRVTKLRGAIYGEHGLYTRQLKRYLKQVREFLEGHPQEIVILHFQTLSQLEKSDKRHLVTMLFQIFGARLARSEVPGSTTLEFLWKSKKQVIVVFPDEDMPLLRNHIFYGLVWPDFEVEAPVPKNQHIEEIVKYLDDFGDANLDAVKAIADKKMYVLKAVLSPDMTMVFGEFRHKSMRDLSENETELVVLDWIHRQVSPLPAGKLNIIALDFVGTGTAVSEILQLNFPKRETAV